MPRYKLELTDDVSVTVECPDGLVARNVFNQVYSALVDEDADADVEVRDSYTADELDRAFGIDSPFTTEPLDPYE